MVTKVATQNNDVVNGTEDEDELSSGGFNNVTLNGLGGDDYIYTDGGAGAVVNGGGGGDFISAAGPNVNGINGPQSTGGTFNGDDGDDALSAIASTGGTFNGGNGNDFLSADSSTSAVLNGDAGDDELSGQNATAGAITFNGGAGSDILSFSRYYKDFTVIKDGDTIFLTAPNYQATVTGIEYFIFHSRWGSDAFTLDTIGDPLPETQPDGTTVVEATGNDYIDGLMASYKWDGPVTFSFGDTTDSRLTLDQQATVGAIFTGSYYRGFDGTTIASLKLYGSVAALIATDVRRAPPTHENEYGEPIYSNDGDIRIQNGSSVEGPYDAMGPGYGDVTFNKALNGTSDDLRYPSLGNYQHLLYLQAVGTALGLKAANSTGGVSDVAVPQDRDSLEYTVMSQRSYTGGPADGDYTLGEWDYPQTFMALDIQALQTLYGADYTTNATSTVYKWDATGVMYVDGRKTVIPGEYLGSEDLEIYRNKVHPGANKIFLTIWDGGGSDTYDFSNYTEAMSIDLSPGGYSRFSQAQLASLGDGVFARGNVYNSYLHNNNPASLIENAIGGSGNDTLRGNIADNVLNGGGGADTMVGLAGNDRYIVDNAGDVVVEAANEGIDRVIVRIADYVLPAHVEEAFAEEGTLATDLRGNELGNLLRG
ncbi:Ca2+-binding RTX toxin-like protein, partial [Ancylobacter sp. 3268]|uniref:M10 family metallopeptidase C-terminal domain-containing protein n=1 Tax=Ancylobacter sp. 3268 TaxID=2817752 RepID=UPI002858894D